MPIVFLFCLNIGIQSASAITCGDCEKCTAQNCTGYTCTDWANVCVKEDKVCAEYGDYCAGWETLCSGSWDYVCQGYGDYCGGWELQCTEMANVCIEYGDYCAGWETLCTGSWENVCQGWSNVCTNYASVCNGYTSVCNGYVPVCTNWVFIFGFPICLNWTNVCTGYHSECTGWHSECTNWKKECTGGYKKQCNGMEYTQCTGGWIYGCVGGYENKCIGVWANVCVGGWIWDCVEGYVYKCVGILYDQCTGGWIYDCVSWNTTCTEWENQCVNTECAEFTCDSCTSYCSGSDSDCGCASCTDCNAQDACVGKDYHDYSCSGNSCSVNITADASGCKGCNSAADCTDYSVGECIDSSSKIASIECNANNKCFYTTESALTGGATTLHNGGLYQYNSCDGNYYLLKYGGQSCETHCEGNDLYIPGIWEGGIEKGCNWNVSSCGPCGCSASGCVASGLGPCPDYCENSNLFINGIECGGKCVWGEPLHCDHGCASPDCAYAPGGCAPSCTGYTCGNAECAGCPFCSVSCPDVCFGEIFETGGYVSNNEKSEMTCFYANQEWCGDGCCVGPPPLPPSCFWGQKSCGWGGGGCGMNEMGYQCKGPSGCTEEICSKGDTYCEVDPVNCPIFGPSNDDPTAVINYSPSDTIYTNETNFTLKGDDSYDDDGFIAKYSWSIPSLGRTKDSVDISDTDFFLGNPAKGIHPVILIVTDNENGTDRADGSFTVIQALTADFEWTPEFPIRNEEVDFTDLSAGDNIVNWSWTFQDGEPSTYSTGNFDERHPQNIKFTSHGSKEVTLTITDSLGKTAFDKDDVNVKIPLPKWKETHPKTENIFDDPFLIFASLFEYFEG